MVLMRRRLVLAALAVGLLVPPLPLQAATVVGRVTCATTATLVYTASGGTDTLLVRNAGTASVFIGPAAVATTSGFEVIAGAALSVPFNGPESVYCIVATGTQRLDTLVARR